MRDEKPKPTDAVPAARPKRPKLHWVGRQTRRLIVLLGVGMLLFVVVFGLYAWQVNTRGDRAVHAIGEALLERGILNLYWSDSDNEDEGWYANATNAKYWQAAMEAVPEAGERPLLSAGTIWTNNIERKQQFHSDMIVALRDVFEAHPRFMQLVNDARAAPPGRFGISNDLADPLKSLDLLGQTRSVARWLEERSRLAQIDQDGETYVQSITAILELTNLLNEEPGVMPGIVSGSIDALASETVMDGLSRITLSTEQIDQLIAAFQQRRTQKDLLKMIGHDLSWEYHLVTADVQSYLRFMEAKQSLMIRQVMKDEPDWIDTSKLPGPIEQSVQNILLTTCPGRYELRHTEILNKSLGYFDQLTSLKDQPKQRWAWIRKTVGEIEARDEDRSSDTSYSRDMRGHDILVTTRTFLLMDSNLASTVAALQVERYRVSKDAWPAQLEDATGELPLDAFGELLRYRMTSDGAMVYCKGYNTIDERGYGQYDDHVPSQFTDADDWAFRLYNPELRNSIPPPDEAVDPDYDELWDE